jgi:phage-related minor tail protein
MSKNMNKRATKRKSATENSILKFLTVSSVSSDSIVKGIIDDIIKTAVKTAEVDEQKTKYLQHFINMTQNTKQRYTFHLHPAFIE